MTVELTSREVFILLQDNVRRLGEEKKQPLSIKSRKDITDKLRVLLDLYDEAEQREVAVNIKRRTQLGPIARCLDL